MFVILWYIDYLPTSWKFILINLKFLHFIEISVDYGIVLMFLNYLLFIDYGPRTDPPLEFNQFFIRLI